MKQLKKLIAAVTWRTRLYLKPVFLPFMRLLESPAAEDLVYRIASKRLDRKVAAMSQILDETKPEVSIVVPIFNVEKYLDVAIKSAIAQTHRNLQIILVDDGSTDGSKAIAERYADKYSNVRLITQKNAGLSAARNTGADSIQSTDYLLFLDSDDVLPSKAVENYLAAIGELNLVVGKPSRLKGLAVHKRHRDLFKKPIVKTTLHENNHFLSDVTAWNKLIKFDFWKHGNYEFPVGFLYEDMALMTRIYAESEGFAVVSKTSYFWRMRVGGGSSITQERWNMKNLQHRLKAILDTLSILNEKFPHNSQNAKLWDYYTWSTARYDINFYLPWVEHCSLEYFEELQAAGFKLFGEADATFWKKVPDRYRPALQALVAGKREALIAAIRKSGLNVPAPAK